MFDYLSDLPILPQMAVYVGGFMLTTYILMAVIHRMVPLEVRRPHNEVIGFLIAVVAVFYGLITASILVIAVNRFDHAQQISESEANLVVDVVRAAKAISPRIEGPVKRLAAQYLDDVIAKEWPDQMQGKKTAIALAALTELSETVSQYEPQSPREGLHYLQMTQMLTRLHDTRRERVFIADESISGAVWVVTLAGSILTICLALLFGIENRRMHFILTSFLAVSLALIFALVAFFDRPFQGNMTVSDEPYRMVRQQLMQP